MKHPLYIVKKSPNDGLWYALGLIISDKPYYMPVSKGYKRKADAAKYAKRQPAIDKATNILGAYSV